jgi:hypothetical protein
MSLSEEIRAWDNLRIPPTNSWAAQVEELEQRLEACTRQRDEARDRLQVAERQRGDGPSEYIELEELRQAQPDYAALLDHPGYRLGEQTFRAVASLPNFEVAFITGVTDAMRAVADSWDETKADSS